jgi:hypothetical protein
MDPILSIPCAHCDMDIIEHDEEGLCIYCLEESETEEEDS